MKQRIVVIGVTGCGKTTIGEAIAAELGLRFVDGDSLHPAENIAKMSAGEPLNDEDRWPWLARVRQTLRSDDGIIIACSALKRSYRDVLRGAPDTRFLFLDLDPETSYERVARREGHFMSADMVASQFAALERPGDDETDVVTVDARRSIDEVTAASLAGLSTRSGNSTSQASPD